MVRLDWQNFDAGQSHPRCKRDVAKRSWRASICAELHCRHSMDCMEPSHPVGLLQLYMGPEGQHLLPPAEGHLHAAAHQRS